MSVILRPDFPERPPNTDTGEQLALLTQLFMSAVFEGMKQYHLGVVRLLDEAKKERVSE